MKVDMLLEPDINTIGEEARRSEALGYSGVSVSEMAHDPFLPLVPAAQQTERVDIMTAIAVAFARNPMTVANLAHDLNAASRGRFVLGIGSQIKPHITKRFSMPWSHPAPRMREFIQAMRAIWACWYEGAELKFQGEFYEHSLMTPYFTPKDTDYGAPPVYLAAVGPKMTEVAGEVADGMIAHAFTTVPYLKEVTFPSLEKGFSKGGKSRDDFHVSIPAFIVTGHDDKEIKQKGDEIKGIIAFYGSTPAYKPVLESIDAGDLQPELHRLSKEGRWQEMGGLIDDDVLNAFAVVGEPKDLPRLVKERFGGLVDRVTLGLPHLSEDELRATLDGVARG